jgi:hypothetical protein
VGAAVTRPEPAHRVAPIRGSETPPPGMDRRTGHRRLPSGSDDPSRLALRTGLFAEVIDLSDAGASVETLARLAPGSQIAVRRVDAKAQGSIAALVVYCRVSRLAIDGSLHYRAGLSFLDAGISYTWPAVRQTRGNNVPAAVAQHIATGGTRLDRDGLRLA